MLLCICLKILQFRWKGKENQTNTTKGGERECFPFSTIPSTSELRTFLTTVRGV